MYASNNSCVDNGLVESVIPSLVFQSDNIMLTNIPTMEEVKNAVFSLDRNSVPGPDGFGGSFYHSYWDIIGADVHNSVLQFFKDGWIYPNLNSNRVVLIPKFVGADRVENFRPIALANFQFKVISKVLADRLAIIMPKIISAEQRGFIRGRHISDCACIDSEEVNMLNNRHFGGNVALKFDIKRAFDTLDWNFLLKILSSFGFDHQFCKWIIVVLHSAKLSVFINGNSVGFFPCKRRVRQGDPLSPLLFCLAEEVLSRGISKLVDSGRL